MKPTMFKRHFLRATAIVLIAMSSCSKDDTTLNLDDATINLKIAGELSVKIVDDNDKPIPDQHLYLYDEDQELLDVTTDANGLVDFGKFNPGNYSVVGKGIEVNGLKYSFNKTVQVVTSEKQNVVINPSTFSGTITFSMYQHYPISETAYSSSTQLLTGTVGLIPVSASFSNLDELKKSIIVSKTLSESSNAVTFNKVPLGSYYLLVYTDDTHYTIQYFSQYNDNYNYQSFTTTKDCNLKYEITVNAQALFNLTGGVKINAMELLPIGYSSYRTQLLTYAKIAILPGSYSSFAYSFNTLQSKILSEQTITETNNPITFQDVPIGSYSILLYTDENHYTLGSNDASYYNTPSTFFVGLNTVSNQTTYAFGTKLKDYVFDNTYYVNTFINGSSTSSPTANSRIYVLKYSDYSNIDYNNRTNETILKGIALAWGTTDENGKATIPTKAFTELIIIAIKPNGDKDSFNTTYYTQGTYSFTFYTWSN